MRAYTRLCSFACCLIIAIAMIAFMGFPRIAWAGDDANMPSSKDETVRVALDSKGSVKSVEVTSTLKNADGYETLQDTMGVTSITNVADDQKYESTGNQLSWKANGDDVTYTGPIDKELPVEVSVTYKLNGSSVDAEALKGAEGTVSIQFDFKNKSYVDGLCTPFATIVGIVFDKDALSGIEVTNGRVIEDGNQSIVVGYAFPGLKESLSLPGGNVDIPEWVEISGKSNAFEMKSALIMVTPSLLDELDASDLDTSDIENSVNSLQSAMGELIDGSSQLTDGLGKISDAMNPVEKGAWQLAEGAQALATGAGALGEGLDVLKEGTQEALSGGYSLKQAADALVSGIYMLSEGDGQTTNGLKGAQAGAAQLSDGVKQLLGGLASESEGLPAASAGLGQAITVLEALPNAGEGADASIALIAASLDALVASGDMSATAAAGLKTQLAQVQAQAAAIQMSAKGVEAGLKEVNAGIDAAANAVSGPNATELVQGSEALSVGLQSAVTGAQNALYGANQVSYGIGQLNTGLDGAVSGLGSADEKGTILNGAAQMTAGATQISETSRILANGIKGIADAVRTAVDGSKQLTEGMETFSSQGISVLAQTVRSDLVGTKNRLVAIADRGRAYDTFSGKPEGVKGSVKFVYEIEGFTLD